MLHVAEPPLGSVLGPVRTGDPAACISDIIMEGQRPLQRADLDYAGPFGHNNFLPEVGRGPDP